MHSHRATAILRWASIGAAVATIWISSVSARPVVPPSAHRTRGNVSRIIPQAPPTAAPSPMVCTPPASQGVCTVQTAPKIFIDFWGFNKNKSDPKFEAPYLFNFVKAIAGSTWLSSVTQYCNKQVPPACVGGNPTVAMKLDSTNPVPKGSITFSQVAAEAQYAASSAMFNDPGDPNANIIVALPFGHPVLYNMLTHEKVCAYHSYANGTVFTAFPYIPDDIGNGTLGYCGRNALNAGDLAGVSIVAGHEIVEAMTDPIVSPTYLGWVNGAASGKNEVGDVCAWINIQYLQLGPPPMYPVQPVFSNSIVNNNRVGCSQSGPNGLTAGSGLRNGYAGPANTPLGNLTPGAATLWHLAHPPTMMRHSGMLDPLQVSAARRFAGEARAPSLRRQSSSGSAPFVSYIYGCGTEQEECYSYYYGGVLAGSFGAAGLSLGGVTVDQNYNVYVAEQHASSYEGQIQIYSPGFASLLSTLNDASGSPSDIALFRKSAKRSLVAVSNSHAEPGSGPPNVAVYTSSANGSSPAYYLTDPSAALGIGVAFDSKGNCYWSFEKTPPSGQVDEFPGCAKGATPVNLMVPPGLFGGIAFDSNDNLYYADDALGTVDVCLSTAPSSCAILVEGMAEPALMKWDGNAVMELSDNAAGLYQFNLYGDVNQLVAGRGFVGVATGPVSDIP